MRIRRAAAFALAAFALLLSGCQQMRIEDFTDRKPQLDLFAYFDGRSQAWGIFEDRFGRLRREFTVDIVGRRQGSDVLVLEEDFVYADGETERRVWTLTRKAPGVYEGHADGVIGVAQGRAAGNAFHFRYDFALKVGESRWNVHFDDWMFLQPGGVILNRARVSKWGLALGEATISFRRLEAARADTGALAIAAQ
jgi:hypothetical protein